MASEPQPALENDRDDAGVREAVLRDRLLRLWSDMEPFADPSSPDAEAAVSPLNEAQRLMLSRWRTVFGDEIRLVRGARNATANSPGNMAGDALTGAVDVATRLRDLLFEGLQNPVVA